LIWAARGKTYQEIGEILHIGFGSVKTHLDAARHKLRCVNLTHAVALALATDVIPRTALKIATGAADHGAQTIAPSELRVGN
jgi:hypothetical protein